MPQSPRSQTDFLAKFVPDVHFHVYNRTNNKEILFHDDQDRRVFVEQYKEYIGEYVDTLAYCLLTNHFHFAVRIKSRAELWCLVEKILEKDRTLPQKKMPEAVDLEFDIHPMIERQFTRLFTAYAMYFNRRHNRSGNLFHRPFKRVAVDDELHLHWLVFYIHHNPRKHGITQDFLRYAWSSYVALVSDKPTAICRDYVWKLFGGKANFVAFHEGSGPQMPERWNFEIEDE